MWIAAVMISLYVMFNIFTIAMLDHVLNQSLDSSIEHEIEHLLNSWYVVGDSLVVTNPSELQEADLVRVTPTPFFLQVYSLDGKLLLSSQNLEHFTEIPRMYPEIPETYFFENTTVGTNELRIGYKRIYNETRAQVGYVQLATTKSNYDLVSDQIIRFNLFTFPLFLILIVVMSIFLARKSYSPINKIIRLARKISAANLSDRLEYDADASDELGRLRDTLNDLFERLHAQIQQIAQFSDNASHQLMTPLTAFSAELDYILKRERSTKEYRDSLATLKEETDRMINIVKTLLLLARDKHAGRDARSVFNLSKTLQEHVKKMYKDRNIECRIDDGIYVRGSDDHFLISIDNVIDNAIKYSCGSEKILLTASKNRHVVRLVIADEGIGMKTDEQERVFERFYRGSSGVRVGTKGHGLGLALAKSITDSMGGKIEFESNQPQGTKVIITIPSLEFDE
jgi:signal transduction histidine kinase